MKIKSHTFDPEADAAYCYLRSAKILDSEEVAPGIIIDWDENDQPVGVEVLYVASRLNGGDLASFLAGLVEGLFATKAVRAEAAE